MKLKRIIQIIFMLAIVLTFGLLMNKEAWAAENYMSGSATYNTVKSSQNNTLPIVPGYRIVVSNISGETVFRNPNVYCVQKSISLGQYKSSFTIGSEIKINGNSHPTLKGLAYILSFSPQGEIENPSLWGDTNNIQKVVWRYIDYLRSEEKAGVIAATLGYQNVYGATSSECNLKGDYLNIYNMAIKIAEGKNFCSQEVKNEIKKLNENVVEVEDLSEYDQNTLIEKIRNNETIKNSYIVDSMKVAAVKTEGIDNNKKSIYYEYLDVNKISATIYKFSGSARQGMILLKNATRGTSKISIQENVIVKKKQGKPSIQKYITQVKDKDGVIIYDNQEERKNRLAYSYISTENNQKAKDLLRIAARLITKKSEYIKDIIISEIMCFPEIVNSSAARNYIRVPDPEIWSGGYTDTEKPSKMDDPVEVDYGDTVTYKMEIYYNQEKEDETVPKKISIKDVFDRYHITNGKIKKVTMTSNKDKGLTAKYKIGEEQYYLLPTNPSGTNNRIFIIPNKYVNKFELKGKDGEIEYEFKDKKESQAFFNDKDLIEAQKAKPFDFYKDFQKYCEVDHSGTSAKYKIRILKAFSALNENNDRIPMYLGNYTSAGDSVWFPKTERVFRDNAGNYLGNYRIIVNENLLAIDYEHATSEGDDLYNEIVKGGFTIEVEVEIVKKDDKNTNKLIENRVELLGESLYRTFDDDYIKIVPRNHNFTFEKRWELGDGEKQPDGVKLEIYNEHKIYLDTIELNKYNNWKITKEYKNYIEMGQEVHNTAKYVKEVEIGYEDASGKIKYEPLNEEWSVIYSNEEKDDEEGLLGLIKNNSIIITNAKHIKTVDLTINKRFETNGINVEIPKEVGVIIQKKENNRWEPEFNESYNFNNENADVPNVGEYEIIYIPIDSNGEGTVTIEGLKADEEYQVQEICIVDNNGKKINIKNTQWTPSYTGGPIKGQDGTITITNSYNQDVSLQKYIINANGNAITGRDNKKATDKTTDEIYYKHNDRNIQKSNSNPFGLKSANPVEINKGAEVTYKITVYNNKESKATGVYVIDNLPTSIVNFKVNGYGYKQLNSKEIQIDIGEIEGKGSKDIEVTVEFPNSNISSNAERTNTATVYASNNQTTYRTTDSDYVVMTKVDLSLQKYIVGLDSTNIDGRVNRKADNNTKDPIYKNGNTNINSTGTNKIDDPVFIESGNTVKYNITIYNNGDKKATGIEVTDALPSKATKYRINSGSWNNTSGGETITLVNNLNLNAGESTTITVEVELNNLENNVLYENKANLNNADQVITGNYRTEDSDYVKKAIYAVSLEKYVTKVESTSSSYSTNTAKDYGDGRKGQAEHKYDNDTNTNNYIKKDENYTQIADIQTGKGPVPVNSGDNVTYKIVLTNNGNVPVKITQINDAMDIGIKNNNANKTTENITDLANEEINPGERKEVTRTYPITAPQLTLGILENSANITEVKNAYGKTVTDTTLNDNKDSDYIKLKGITISGKVWEDTSDTKDNRVNGIYDNGETLKENITVKLQQSTNGSNFIDYKTTKTNGNGEYTFEDVAHSYNKNSSGAYSYYIYQVVFEYDGVTYTHTTKGDINASNYQINSNASESDTTRTNFNNKFTEIKSDGAYDNSGRKSGAITYKTINEEGNAPMSVHEYNDSLMKIASSTDQINLGDYVNSLDYLKYINLGLRGRDVFDLRINTEVVSANVTVNGVTGTYGYNSKNGIEIRDNDLVMTDNTNKMSKEAQESITEENQSVRKTDLTALNAIQVTYKVTVKNESQTSGRATLITDYFDKALEFTGAEYNGAILTTGNVDTTNATYNKVAITIPDTMLGQSESIDIYLTFNVTGEGINAIKAITDSQAAVFYNMAEIESYQTNRNNVDIYTVGLIDKDSAPGSADEEKVRLGNPLDIGNITTVQYYFNKSELTRLKYEDDTSTAPTLVFRTSDNQRTLTGKVFEDDTKVENNVRSGDGKLGNKYRPSDEAENKIEGIKVELIDSVGNVIDTKTTDANGEYTFSGFLPGEYTIKYTYCGDEKTIYYNGQAYQSTNNTAFDKKTDPYWYVYNSEGYSIADENEETRKTVNGNWAKQDNEVTTIFKYVQDKGIGWNPYNDSEFLEIIKGYHTEYSDDDAKNYIKEFIEKNTMDAQTSTMKVELEQATLEGNNVKFSTTFGEYEIKNVNFGIALRPKTIIDTVLGIQKITIMDSANKSVLVSAELQKDGKYKITKGKVFVTDNSITIQVDDDKLHGATIEIVYNITVTNNSEKNYNGEEATTITINKVVVYLDNGLRFSTNSIEQLSNLNNTARVNYLSDLVLDEEFKELIESLESEDRASFVKLANGTQSNWKLDIENFANGSNSSATPLVSTDDNSLINQNLGPNESVSVTLPASKVTTNNGEFTFNEAAEIGQINAESGVVISKTVLNNGIKASDSEDDPAGAVYSFTNQELDTGVAKLVTITPPTGENRNYTEVIIISIASIAILAGGIIGIKKFMKK